MDDQLLTTAQAADLAGVSPFTVTDWINKGQLPAERVASGGRGRPGYRIKESDLTAFNRRRLLGAPTATNGAMLLTDDDRRADALSLEVFWPDRAASAPFSTALFEGYSEFRAVTYTASLDTILKLLLIQQQFERVEVIFGSAGLLKGKEYPLLVQEAIDHLPSRDFIGLGGSKSAVTQALLEQQVSGRLRLLGMAPGVVHSKYYLLEGKAGRRVMVGSANLSEKAMSGRQGEVLLAYDNHPFMWDAMVRKYEALAALASQFPISLKTEVQPAHLLAAEDLPAFRKVKDGEPVQVFAPVTDANITAGDHPALLARVEDLERSFGHTLSTNLPAPNQRGMVEITPAIVRQINRDRSALTLAPEVKPESRLEYVGQRFIYNGKAVEPSDDPQAVALDALLITQYFDAMRDFGEGAATLQRNYFGFMGWMFFAPFMAWARRERCKESPGNYDFKLVALIYGPANAGKSALVGFLQEAMFGDRSGEAKGKWKFTPTDFRKLRALRGALPASYDDVPGRRFSDTRGGETTGETIVKDYDQAQNEGNEFYPCLVANMNQDAREFSTQVRKRCLMVYASQCAPGDDAALKSRLDAIVQPLHNRIGTAFYAEYLNRMGGRLREIEPGEGMQFDYLLESTSLIRELLDEHRQEGEDRPAWCRPVGWQEYDESAWQLKRDQLRTQLAAENWTDEYPPARGHWTLRGENIMLGVDNRRAALNSKEYPSQIVDDTVSIATVIGLNQAATVAMLKRGDAAYELPLPAAVEPPPAAVEPPPAVEEPPPAVEEPARPGLFTRLKRALR